MSFEHLIAFSWLIFISLGFLTKARGFIKEEPYVLVGLTAGGALAFALDYRAERCGSGFSLLFCSGEASVSWGLVLGVMAAHLLLQLPPSNDQSDD